MNSSQTRLDEFKQRSSITEWEIVTVTFDNADVDVEVVTKLSPLDPELIEYQVLNASGPALVFHDTSASRMAWSAGLIRLRSAVAGLKATLLLTVLAEDRPKLDGGSKSIASSFLTLPSNVAYKDLNFATQQFRGLHLRTHPDQDLALTKVMLVHADEIVMDDATRLSTWDRIIADSAVSGAGGIDTGSIAASTWYEIYSIAKDDGTKHLLLHRAKNFSKDTAFETARDNNRMLRRATGTATDKLAQGIQFATAGGFEFADVELVTNSTAVNGRVWVSIYADSGGSPTGAALATSDKLTGNTISTGFQWIRFPFRSPFTVVAGTQYHLVLEGDYTRSDTVNIAWAGVTAGGYASGVAKEFNGAAWGAAVGPADFRFRAFVTVNDTTVTMPAGYTKKALIGYVYSNGSSNFQQFVAIDNFVLGGAALVIVNNVVLTIPSLIDLSSFVPPIRVTLLGSLANGTANNFTIIGGVPIGYEGFANSYVGMVQRYFDTTGGFATFLNARMPTEAQGIYVQASVGTAYLYYGGFIW